MILSDFETCYKTLIEQSNLEFFESFIKPELTNKFPNINWEIDNALNHSGTFKILGVCNSTGYTIKLFYQIKWLKIQSQFEIRDYVQRLDKRSQIFDNLSELIENLLETFGDLYDS